MLIIDTHEHLFSNKDIEETKELLIESNKKYNIYGGLVSFSINERKDHPKSRYSFKEGLKITLDFCKENPNFKMLIWFLPQTTKCYKYLDNFIEKNRKYIKGLKMHPWASDITVDNKKCEPFIEIARKYNLPILVHTALDEKSKIIHLEKAAKKYKDVNFIAAHLELESDNRFALEVLTRNPNIYGDLTWVNPENLLYAKELNVLDKIMYGSDNPIDGLDTYLNAYYQGYFNNSIDLTEDEFERIMYKNALKIYNLNLDEFRSK